LSVIILDGKKIAENFNNQTRSLVGSFVENFSRKPKLSIFLVGDDENSLRYDTLKVKLANGIGIDASLNQLSDDISERQLIAEIDKTSKKCDGLLVQFPLPRRMNTNNIVNAINPLKEVDGIHPYHLEKLFDQKNIFTRISSLDEILPVTPTGVVILVLEAMRLLGKPSVLNGMSCVVCGRSKLVGIPVSMLLQGLGATVSVCHSETLEYKRKQLIREADIVVSAVGKAGFIPISECKSGAICIDVANNYDDQGKVRGDFTNDVENSEVAAITPVPGGVGPMTLAMLMRNVINSALIQEKYKS